MEGEIASPRRRVGVGFVASYVFAYVGLWMTLLTPVTVSLALKIRQIDPEGAAGSLARVLGLALLTVTAQEILSVATVG